MAKDFDASLNTLSFVGPDDWAAFLCARVGISTVPAEAMDTDLATTVQADRLFRVKSSSPAILHLEFESSSALRRPARLMRYNVLAHTTDPDLLPVHSVLMLLRPEANSSDLTGLYQVIGENGAIHDFHYYVVRLWEERVETLLNAGSGLAPLALLTREAGKDLPGTVVRIEERLRAASVPDNLQVSIWHSTYVLSGLIHADEQLTESLRRRSMSIHLEDSSTYQAIHKRGRVTQLHETVLRKEKSSLVTCLSRLSQRCAASLIASDWN